MAESERYADYMYGLIDRVMKEIGPRESCSEQERRLGALFAEEVRPACHDVHVEKFTCSPRAFLGFFPYLVTGYLAALALYFVLPPLSLIITAMCVGVLYFELIRYRELIDPLFRKREGENVVAVLRPGGEARRRFIVSAHLDSAYEFKVWYWLKGASVPAMILAFAGPLVLLGASLARTLAGSTGFPDGTAFRVLGYVCLGFVPVIVPFAFFHTGDVVPGAMDDMAGVSVLAGLAKYLEESRESGGSIPATPRWSSWPSPPRRPACGEPGASQPRTGGSSFPCPPTPSSWTGYTTSGTSPSSGASSGAARRWTPTWWSWRARPRRPTGTP